MPALSTAQQRVMALALAYQRGKLKHAPPKVRKLAASMKESDLRAFAERTETPEERKRRLTAKIARDRARGK